MKTIKGGVTKPKGFKANGLCCGIKRSGKPDLTLISCDTVVPTAGVFTKNSIKAAPLIMTQKHLRNNQAQAIIINSGNANCFTGNFGLIYAKSMTEVIADLIGAKASDVLVSSTGIIGKPLPYKKIAKAAGKLVAGLGTSMRSGLLAAKGILTTDKVTKEIAVQTSIDGKTATIGACSKGSGMIEPNMATMLAFVTTDVAISPKMLKLALKKATDKSFNCITVDGCMSTNDMVTVMASGQAKNKTITSAGKDFDKFYEALEYVCLDMAKKIVMDGEGATKFIKVNIISAPTAKAAKAAAMAVANSNLVKTAAFGCNPNWGRVAAAVGSLGLKITEEDLKVTFSSFAKKNITINVDLNSGKHCATVYTSDLSHEYIRINGKYN
ncbi:MAG: bifunctional glutamate N-acetyltransferase/amino-acid acetyltransferase ArgJ [Candidatus Omnitrophica bacterium]|nr:bifunctional glutamate N-acetyltransferase/amino-acid acetyltransferase ArgJ [Candidatus Omnitrophota bacterium]